ncbi:MAG: transglutaminase family protein [Roseiarcus sp.]|jgi:transglutaminase-like putative cysteine protease
MRIRISQETSYAYAPAARSIIQVLRLTPRSFEAQYVLRWRIATDIDCTLRQSEDSLGNIVHSFSHPGPVEHIGVTAEGEVETFDAVGVVRGSVEPLPPEIYLRAAPLAEANGALRKFAEDAAGGKREALERLHPLMAAIHETMTFAAAPTLATTTAAEAFALRSGVGRDFAHVFIACSRWLGVPARYVSGYLVRPDAGSQDASHAWAESYVPDLGWVAFDAANDTCTDERYVRVAIGFDYQSAAPVRGARAGVGSETLSVSLRIGQTQRQSQSQN